MLRLYAFTAMLEIPVYQDSQREQDCPAKYPAGPAISALDMSAQAARYSLAFVAAKPFMIYFLVFFDEPRP